VNTLKPLLIIAIVGGIGYGAWSRLNRKPDNSIQGWDSTPSVQLGEAGTNWSPGGAPAATGSAPASSGAAPTYSGLAPDASNAPAPPPTDTQSASPTVAPLAGQPLGAAPAFADQMPAADAASNGGTAAPADPNGSQSGGAPSVYAGAAPANSGATAANSQPAYPQTGYPQAGDLGVFGTVLETARRELDAGRLAEGLFQLSEWYDSPQLSPAEHQQLNKLLDQVAGTVIYSTRSFGEPPYEVQPGERLDDIAARYNVSPQLLAKINGLEDPQNLRPGEQLKVLRGPFDASISLEKRVVTLRLSGNYAGRFAVGFGRDWPPREGEFVVENKVVNPEYRGADRQINGGDPSNPLGSRWVGLSGNYGIHGTNDPNALGSPEQLGCIALGQRDLEDMFDILTVGSRETIHR
jgi:lipoprotein-anchoring transpeptidase ErfK/SrfK